MLGREEANTVTSSLSLPLVWGCETAGFRPHRRRKKLAHTEKRARYLGARDQCSLVLDRLIHVVLAATVAAAAAAAPPPPPSPPKAPTHKHIRIVQILDVEVEIITSAQVQIMIRQVSPSLAYLSTRPTQQLWIRSAPASRHWETLHSTDATHRL